MADDKEPMIKLDPGGVARILSYNVPEPTTYTGRIFIDLQLGASYFRTDLSPLPPPPKAADKTGTPSLASRSALAAAAVPAEPPPVAIPVIPASERISEKLARLDPAEVQAMQLQGKQLQIYRSMYGTLTYRYVDAPTIPPAARARELAQVTEESSRAAALPIQPPEPPDGGGTTLIFNVEIMSPAAGTTIKGPLSGVMVGVAGTAGIDQGLGSITKVEVQFGTGPFVAATPGTPNNWASWTCSANVTASGVLTITARATHSTGRTITDAVNVTVALADTNAPVVAITGTVPPPPIYGDADGASVQVVGTASDAETSVQVVEVSVDGGPFSKANQDAGAWSAWSAPVTLAKAGAHTITARATDQAGNISTAKLNATVTIDTTPPTVTIVPPPPAALNGGFNGVIVPLSGTSADNVGVVSVGYSLDNSPNFVTAQPKAPGDWSSWTGSLLITQAGSHRITARALDAAGNHADANLDVVVTLAPDVVTHANRLMLVESYRLSSFLGNYGAGRTIKTFSLLPGEKTTISVKTYTKSETSAQDTRSILDSFTQESADDFEKSVALEHADKQSNTDTINYNVSGEAGVNWGKVVSASIKAGVSGGTNAAREEAAKNVVNAMTKHAAKASAKRDMQVNTSYEVKEESGVETSLQRTIENINVSRTLNFVFRQMNQEFISILHLVDVRVGFYRAATVTPPGSTTPELRYEYRETTLPQLGQLLSDMVVAGKVTEVRNMIIEQLSTIFDYKDRLHSFVEEQPFKDRDGKIVPNSQYLRVKKGYTSSYIDDATGTEIKVPGIIVAADKNTLRTEAMIVEAMLGQGDGLDGYSHGLQDEAVRARQMSNVTTGLEQERTRLALRIIQDKDADAAKLFDQLFPHPATQLIPIVATPSQGAANGRPA